MGLFTDRLNRPRVLALVVISDWQQVKGLQATFTDRLFDEDGVVYGGKPVDRELSKSSSCSLFLVHVIEELIQVLERIGIAAYSGK